MSDTYIPVVQVECTAMPSRHEQGIPRFINHMGHVEQPLLPGDIVMPAPMQQVLPIYCAQPQPTQNLAVPHVPPNMVPAPYPVYQHQHHANIDHAFINPTPFGASSDDSPPSPSMSSTVSSVSVYEDCQSLPPTSPRPYHDPFYQRPPPTETDHRFEQQQQQQNDAALSISCTNSTSMTSIASDDSSARTSMKMSGVTPQSSSIKPEQAMALVNERLRNRIADMEKKMAQAMTEVTFLGDRNWRLEAHLDCLMHTLEILGVTDVEDLTGKSLPLPMFKVKVKAGYRLGPFNRLPRRALWSFEDDVKNPTIIDLGSDRARPLSQDEAKIIEDEDDFQLPAGSDIGLSVRQMFHYERQIEELRRENHGLVNRVDQATEKEAGLDEKSKKCREENAELHDDLEDAKREIHRLMQRLRCYEDPGRPSGRGAMPPPPHLPREDMSDHGSDSSSSSYGSHPDYAEGFHRACESSRAGPYYRRGHGGGGMRDGRRHRNARGR